MYLISTIAGSRIEHSDVLWEVNTFFNFLENIFFDCRITRGTGNLPVQALRPVGPVGDGKSDRILPR
jgi:hypothetical protein